MITEFRLNLQAEIKLSNKVTYDELPKELMRAVVSDEE